MCEITVDNFDIKFQEINYNIQKANYIAIDTEFTGLHLDGLQPSLKDSADDRYQKLKKSVELFNLVQIGLSTFRYCFDQKIFVSDSYNFYIFPRNYGLLNDMCYSHQTSCVEFLCKYEFDFNKLYYKGIPYMNNKQEKQFEKKLKNQIFFAGIQRDIDEKQLQKVCSQITDWLLNATIGELYELEKVKDLKDIILHNELRHRFDSIWTHQDGETIFIEKISKEKRAELELLEPNEIKKMSDSFLGFTKIFRLLIQYKKPLIVHNGIMDLMYLHEKFYDPLPTKFKEFKSNINEMFPLVYDTKYISIESKRMFKEMKDLYDNTMLEPLFNSLNREVQKKCSLYMPSIKHSPTSSIYSLKSHAHEAGYDAFMCGSVFLKLAHALATYDSKNCYNIRQNNMNDYFLVMKPFENKIPLIKASLDYINLCGKDSKSVNVKVLFVKSKKEISPFELTRLFSSYGLCELNIQSKNTALVTLDNLSYSKFIQSNYTQNSYEISEYSFWKHSPLVKPILGSCAIATGTLVLLTVIGLKKY